MDLFCFPISDHVMFPREFFISYAYMCTCIRPHLKETVPLGNITWSEMGKQNVQAKLRGPFMATPKLL